MMLPPLPSFVLACQGSIALIIRALAGELPRNDYYDAWDALADPKGYKPSEPVRQWIHVKWQELMAPTVADEGQAVTTPGPACAPIPAIPAILAAQRAPVLAEPWMQPFLDEFAKHGIVVQAAKAGPVNLDTVLEYRKHDPEFARAYELAKDEFRGLIRSTIKGRGIDGWEEPVYGRMDRVVEGKVICETVVVGYIRKHDNRVLMRLAEAWLDEFAKKGEGTNINISNTASASASADARVEVSASPELLDKLQQRSLKQMKKKLERATRPRAGKST